MIDVKRFVDKVLEIAAERPSYRLGGDGSDGTCDCIGLIIGALERAGEAWKGTHGSNWTARNAMSEMIRGVEAADLQVGWLVFKAKAPGESGYDLPSRYANDSDQMDYYHVGVVTGVEPLEITHCTVSGSVNGITVDSKQGKWLYAGPLEMVAYSGGEGAEMTMAKVRAPNGGTVNMRKAPVPTAALIERVPVGDEVEVLSSQLTWSLIKWRGKSGYMMTEFLDMGEEAPADGVTITLSAGAAGEFMAALKAAGIQ